MAYTYFVVSIIDPSMLFVHIYYNYRYYLLYFFLLINSHIQRIVLATEETTVTQQVSHRPIKCQSRLWSQRSTTRYSDQQGSKSRPKVVCGTTSNGAPTTNAKTVHQTSLYSIISRATSIDSICCCLPTASVLSNKASLLHMSTVSGANEDSEHIIFPVQLTASRKGNHVQLFYIIRIAVLVLYCSNGGASDGYAFFPP